MKRKLFTGILTLLILQYVLGCSKPPLEILNGKWQAQDVPYSLELVFDTQRMTIEQTYNGEKDILTFGIIKSEKNMLHVKLINKNLREEEIIIVIDDTNSIKTIQKTHKLTLNRIS